MAAERRGVKIGEPDIYWRAWCPGEPRPASCLTAHEAEVAAAVAEFGLPASYALWKRFSQKKDRFSKSLYAEKK